MTAPARFDTAHFAHMTGDDRALQLEILALFRGQVGAWETLLRPDAPGASWRDAAHTLKGSARGIGLWALAEACETAEAAGDADIPVALAALNAALFEALQALSALDQA
jgi:HPt (histidine-containing phosphotransfer) domain-containing protein